MAHQIHKQVRGPIMDKIIADLAALPLIVRGSPDEVFKAIRELQEAARKSNPAASPVAPQQSDEVDQFEAWIKNYWPDWRQAEPYPVELMRAAWDAAARLSSFNDMALRGAIDYTVELETKLAASVNQPRQLTDLQRAVMEHDDDMARLDRNTLVPAPSAAIQNESRAEELTRQQIVQAITDIQEARESHVKWANHLRNEKHGLCEGCDNFAAHIGNADYHDEWIAKYDNVIAVLARTPFAARDLPNAPEVDPNRKCWASTTKEICTDPRGCDERGCQRYTDEDYRSKFNQPTSRDIRAELITAHNAMPRRRCSVHKREEFKYESLEHELHAAAAESSYSEGVDDAARVSGVLNKVEQSNLSSLARKAAGEIFEFGKYDLEPERAKDQITAIIERCLSEGEA